MENSGWLVFSTHLKNMSQNGNLAQGSGVKIPKIFELPPPSHYLGLLYLPGKPSALFFQAIVAGFRGKVA